MYKKILIIGDSGRGKTTFTKKLSEKMSIPYYETDDFFWKTKYSEPNNKEQSIKDINKIYDLDSWIVEGSTRHLMKGGLDKSDIIFYFKFRNFLIQYFYIIKRAYKRRDNIRHTFELLRHLTKKKYSIKYNGDKETTEELVKPYTNKIVYFHNFKEINNYLNQ
ncbi:MAG: hypothetical protein ABL917_03095 [Parcubacteria group bacterium]